MIAHQAKRLAGREKMELAPSRAGICSSGNGHREVPVPIFSQRSAARFERQRWVYAAFVWAAAMASALAEPAIEPLYPDGVPGAKDIAAEHVPHIAVWLPPAAKANGAAIVVCPGGGYGFLADDHEGRQIAEWLNSLGVAAFVLKYRHRNAGNFGHPAPLDDAQRAIRIVRSRADQWQVDPARIGILGFSAGGHLASTAGTHFDRGKSDAADPIERASCRPDFMVLCYPVISLTTAYKHQGSLNNLLGKDPDPKLVESLSNENQVTAETPPTFLLHTDEDTAVPPENSVLFYLALRRAKVPAELHVYSKGPHGIGLGKDTLGARHWPEACAEWMQGRGLLGKESAAR